MALLDLLSPGLGRRCPADGDAAPLLALAWTTLVGALAHAGFLGLPARRAWGGRAGPSPVPLAARCAGGARGDAAVSGRLVRVRPALAAAGTAARRGQRARCCAGRPAARRRCAEPVSVLLPVRDEAAQVGGLPGRRCSPSAASPTCESSSSTTARPTAPRPWSARRPTRGSGCCTADPPPAGWLGKPHACAAARGAADAAARACWSFVDADVRLRPDAVAATVALLARTRSTWSRPTRGRSPTAPPSGWSSRCCSGRG